MTKPIEIKKGQKFGRLTATGNSISRDTSYGKKERLVECVCDCGNMTLVRPSSLNRGITKSCGCLMGDVARENIKKISKTHGMAGTKFYTTFKSIKRRCNSPKSKSYKDYGAKGIRCEWRDFKDFYYTMYKSYTEHTNKYGEQNTTIERIDVNGNYCIENCRWATKLEQANNKRTNRIVEYRGKKYTLSELCRKCGVEYEITRKRINRGWDLERAISTPPIPR